MAILLCNDTMSLLCVTLPQRHMCAAVLWKNHHVHLPNAKVRKLHIRCMHLMLLPSPRHVRLLVCASEGHSFVRNN